MSCALEASLLAWPQRSLIFCTNHFLSEDANLTQPVPPLLTVLTAASLVRLSEDAVHVLAATVALCHGSQWRGLCEQQVQVHPSSPVLGNCPSGLCAQLCSAGLWSTGNAVCLPSAQACFADLRCISPMASISACASLLCSIPHRTAHNVMSAVLQLYHAAAPWAVTRSCCACISTIMPLCSRLRTGHLLT
jgi:hypothetical protein